MKSAIVLIFVFLLSACSPMWEDGEYEVYYIDGHISLGIKLDNSGTYHGRVDHKVIAVGANEKYIVAKQLPNETEEVSYYYIVREDDNKYLNQDEITQGPFSEIKFEELTMRLGLPSFSKEFQKFLISNAKGNLGSRRIKEKTGAIYLRTEPASFVDPSYTEHEIWELSKHRWKQYQS